MPSSPTPNLGMVLMTETIRYTEKHLKAVLSRKVQVLLKMGLPCTINRAFFIFLCAVLVCGREAASLIGGL